MKNAEEHNKILMQVAALERDSVNYFDVEKEFFLIDSDNLSKVQSRFYGYSIQADGIYEAENLTPEAVKNLDGRGCYVCVEVHDGQITIKQDLNGDWGIYLFRHGDYFALSNSFFRLLDYVKFRYPLTVNRDYCQYLFLQGYASYSYSETAVNEIQLVDRSAILQIDIAKKNLQIELIRYNEHSCSPDSEEGIVTLDRWFDFWCNVLNKTAQRTEFFQSNLSGGIDSRVSFICTLNSGIDLNKIRIASIKSTFHTYGEDYKLASEIAEHYGFKLNKPFPEQEFLNYSLADVFNINLYCCQPFSNVPRFQHEKSIDKYYVVGGAGGETIRNYFNGSPRTFIEKNIKKTAPYSYNLSQELSHSIENILESAFRDIRDKHKIEDTDSEDITQYLSLEAMSRHHFGKEAVRNYLMKNILMLSPILDPELHTLQLCSQECSDPQLLIALLFTRYEPDLLNFIFQGDRSFPPETLEAARKINERFPRRLKTDKVDREEVFHIQTRDTQVEKLLATGRNNPDIPINLPRNCLKTTFMSSKAYGLFTTHFDEELYNYAATAPGNERRLYAICGVEKVLEDVLISNSNRPLYQDMKNFLEQDFCKIRFDDNENAQIIKKFKSYFTARIDIKFAGNGDFQIISISDDKANIFKPDWYQENGVGYLITSYASKLHFVAKAVADGQIQLSLRGKDSLDPKTQKRIPYWIDYTKFILNGQVVFDALTPAWHDKPCRYNWDTKADEEIIVEVEWLPHRSDT